MEKIAVEFIGVESRRKERSEVEWRGMEWNAMVGMEWNEMQGIRLEGMLVECKGMERNGM